MNHRNRNLPARGDWPSAARPRALRVLMLALLPLASIGCATLGSRGESLVPTRYQVRTGPFLIYSNTPIPADSAAVRCLHSLETDLTSRLDYRTPPDQEPVEIYVLNDRNAYTHFLKFYYPELPQRRAFFLAQGERRVIYTYLSDRLEEDLRHEATHALVRGRHGDLPLWLDEGLAEYFEARDGSDEHLAKILEDLRSGWKPDLRRLEGLKDIHEMTPRDYRESWAWVHLMLDGAPADRSPLLGYLDRSKPGARRPELSASLTAVGLDAASLEIHLRDTRSSLASKSGGPQPLSMTRAAPDDPHVRAVSRSQSARDVEPEPRIVRAQTPQRPSFLRRIGMFLGF